MDLRCIGAAPPSFQCLARPFSLSPRVLHNPLARRRKAGFPMIGKYFSNGWKISACFSNDWKNLSRVFQRLEKFFGDGSGKQTGQNRWKQNGWPKEQPKTGPLFVPLFKKNHARERGGMVKGWIGVDRRGLEGKLVRHARPLPLNFTAGWIPSPSGHRASSDGGRRLGVARAGPM